MKRIAALLLALALALFGCTKQEQNGTENAPQNDVQVAETLTGTVETIDEKGLSLSTAPDMPNGQMPQGNPPEMPNGQTPQGNPPDMSNGQMPQGTPPGNAERADAAGQSPGHAERSNAAGQPAGHVERTGLSHDRGADADVCGQRDVYG